MTTKKLNGFTLVEMLVVIAIISILASALFPAIQNAMGQATATALKNKGRGIWVAINSANMEREPLNQGTLWPVDTKNSDSIGTSSAYFTFLMSDGANKTTIAEASDERLVSDLTPESLIGQGITAAKVGGGIEADNNAWKVMEVGDNTPSELPFIFTKNLNETELKAAGSVDDKTTKITLNADKPFGNTRAVWVTRGGGVFDARRKYLTTMVVMGVCGTNLTVWAN